MKQTYRISAYAGLVIALLLASIALTPVLFAQESDLAATIRAELLADPETASLSEAEMDAMVAALAAQAEEQGLTTQDIEWQPAETASQTQGVPEEADTCTGVPGFLCALNESLGFSGGNALIPLWLFISSLALLFILTAMIKIYRKTHMVGAPPAGGM